MLLRLLTDFFWSLSILVLITGAANAATPADNERKTPSGLTSSQQELTAVMAECLVDAKNSSYELLALASAPSGRDPLLGRTKELNLLYGTSLVPQEKISTADREVLKKITRASDYDARRFPDWLVQTTALYKTLQAAPDLRALYNRQFEASLPAEGPPSPADRRLLFWLTASPTYDPGEFLYSLLTNQSKDS